MNWTDDSDNEDGFRVERASSGSGPWTEVGIVGTDVTSYTDIGLSCNTAYYYRVRAYNTLGMSEYSNIAGGTTPACEEPTLKNALDAVNLEWRTGGTRPWYYQRRFKHDGLDAARSGVIGHGQRTWILTTVTGPGTLRFWWRSSSEPNDPLRLYLNGVMRARISGLSAWQQRTIQLGRGTHVLRWMYSKNSTLVAGRDCVWLDQVSFAASPTLGVQASDNAETGHERVALNIVLTKYRVILSWQAEPAKAYEVLYRDSLSDPNWQLLASEIQVHGAIRLVEDSLTDCPQRFYMVREK